MNRRRAGGRPPLRQRRRRRPHAGSGRARREGRSRLRTRPRASGARLIDELDLGNGPGSGSKQRDVPVLVGVAHRSRPEDVEGVLGQVLDREAHPHTGVAELEGDGAVGLPGHEQPVAAGLCDHAGVVPVAGVPEERRSDLVRVERPARRVGLLAGDPGPRSCRRRPRGRRVSWARHRRRPRAAPATSPGTSRRRGAAAAHHQAGAAGALERLRDLGVRRLEARAGAKAARMRLSSGVSCIVSLQ